MVKKKSKAPAIIIVVLLGVISVLFLFNIYRTNYLPIHYFIALSALILLLNLCIDWLLLSRGKAWKKILAAILAVVMCFLFIAGTAGINNLNRTVTEIGQPLDERDEYSVLALRTDPLSTADEVQNVAIGAVQLDDYSVISELLPNNVGAPINVATSYFELAGEVLGGMERLILFNEAYRSLVIDIYPDFNSQTKVIASLNEELVENLGNIQAPSETVGQATEEPTVTESPVVTIETSESNETNETSSDTASTTTEPPVEPEPTQPVATDSSTGGVLETFAPEETVAPVQETVIDYSGGNAADGSSPFIVYISGTDSYGGINSRGRSDVNIVMAVNPGTHQIGLVSIPRDAYVSIPATGGYKDKLTHAGILGVQSSLGAVEQVIGRNISTYAKVNFTTLVGLVDLMGGITIYNPIAFRNFPIGNITLSGSSALAYARERKALSGGDIARGANQLRVIQGIINAAIQPANLANYNAILQSLSSSFRTNLSADAIATLVRGQLSSGSGWNIQMYAMTGSGRTGLYSYFMPRYRLSFIQLSSSSINRARSLIASVVS